MLERSTSAKPGMVIFLNDATSAGKSTIARLLQDRIEAPFWHISIDHFREAGVLPLDRIRTGEFAGKDLRTAFFDGFHRALPAYVSAGNNLIFEHIIETREWLDLLVEGLGLFDVYFVGVTVRSMNSSGANWRAAIVRWAARL